MHSDAQWKQELKVCSTVAYLQVFLMALILLITLLYKESYHLDL